MSPPALIRLGIKPEQEKEKRSSVRITEGERENVQQREVQHSPQLISDLSLVPSLLAGVITRTDPVPGSAGAQRGLSGSQRRDFYSPSPLEISSAAVVCWKSKSLRAAQ